MSSFMFNQVNMNMQAMYYTTPNTDVTIMSWDPWDSLH
jgi:hypothetical protein